MEIDQAVGSSRVVVTGSAGHLGEALVRTLEGVHDVVGVDVLPSPTTHVVASIGDREAMRAVMRGAQVVLHTATLHKPHVATHTHEAFVDVNVRGTLVLLEEAAAAGVKSFVFTSTTSTFGHALVPPPGAPAAWIDEDVVPVAKNVYGVTKVAAEGLCELIHRTRGLPVVVLRTSRFFPEDDDDADTRRLYTGENAKVVELLYRRADIEDIVDAHMQAIVRAQTIGFGRFVVSATTPFRREDLAELRVDAPAVVRRYVPAFEEVFAARGWRMFPSLDRVYVNARAREVLGWRPQLDFATAVDRLAKGEDAFSPLARAIGAKGYHRAPG